MILLAGALILGLANTSFSQTDSFTVTVDSFSASTEADGLPKGWEPLVFRKVDRRTSYAVEHEGENYFVVARSTAADTGIMKRVDLSIKDYPILSWKWKVSHSIKGADLRKRSGDDYAARVYVAFRYDPAKSGVFERWKYKTAKATFGEFPPKAALIYVWDNKYPIGEIHNNAYTNHAKMIVTETGDSKAGQWVSEQVNLLEDYKKAVGGDPPPLEFIALMTDTDQTGEAVTAYYDDVVLKRQP